MKLVMCLLIMSFGTSTFASEAPSFSAFNVGDELYVTILGDSCNHISGSLNVAPGCKEDRETRNFAITCSAELIAASTRIGCQDDKRVPRVLTLSLTKNKVAHEAKLLHLMYDDEEIEVRLDR